MPVRILSWKPVGKGSIIGRADIVLGRALEIHGLLVMQANGKNWISFPAIPKFDFATDKMIRGPGGKLDYSGGAILKWTDRASSDRFRHSIFAAITSQFGEDALNGGAS